MIMFQIYNYYYYRCGSAGRLRKMRQVGVGAGWRRRRRRRAAEAGAGRQHGRRLRRNLRSWRTRCNSMLWWVTVFQWALIFWNAAKQVGNLSKWSTEPFPEAPFSIIWFFSIINDFNLSYWDKSCHCVVWSKTVIHIQIFRNSLASVVRYSWLVI